jgi:hypothetical protein
MLYCEVTVDVALRVRDLRCDRQQFKYLRGIRPDVQPASIHRLYVAVRILPCQFIIHENAIVDPTKVDCVCVDYRKCAFSIGDEVARERNPFAELVAGLLYSAYWEERYFGKLSSLITSHGLSWN